MMWASEFRASELATYRSIFWPWSSAQNSVQKTSVDALTSWREYDAMNTGSAFQDKVAEYVLQNPYNGFGIFNASMDAATLVFQTLSDLIFLRDSVAMITHPTAFDTWQKVLMTIPWALEAGNLAVQASRGADAGQLVESFAGFIWLPLRQAKNSAFEEVELQIYLAPFFESFEQYVDDDHDIRTVFKEFFMDGKMFIEDAGVEDGTQMVRLVWSPASKSDLEPLVILNSPEELLPESIHEHVAKFNGFAERMQDADFNSQEFSDWAADTQNWEWAGNSLLHAARELNELIYDSDAVENGSTPYGISTLMG